MSPAACSGAALNANITLLVVLVTHGIKFVFGAVGPHMGPRKRTHYEESLSGTGIDPVALVVCFC